VYRDLFFYSKDTIFENGGLERMRIASTGNVGIGTTSPGYKLDVSTTSATSPLRVIDTTTGYKSFTVDYSGSFVTQLNFGIFGRFEYDGNGGVMTIANRSTQAGSSSMRFVMGTTERMRITDTGNVGIGDSSPSDMLVVNGRTRINGTNRLAFGNSSGGYAQIGVSGALEGNLQFLTFNGTSFLERMRITTAGNVGIGTTSPGYKLSIDDNTITSTPVTLLQFNSEGIADNGGYNIDFRTSTNDLADRFVARIRGIRESTGALSQLSFWTEDGSALQQRMTIRASGNVGIGTTSPGTKLDVNGVITATGGNSTNWNTAYGWGDHAGLYVGLTGNQSVAGDKNFTGKLISTGTGELFALESGNSPYIRFHMGGTATNGTYLIKTWGSSRVLSIETMGSSQIVIDENNNQTDKAFIVRHNGTAGPQLFRVQEDGNTYSYGNLLVTGNVTGSNLNVSNWDTAYSWGDHAGQYLPITGGTVGGAVTINGPLVVNGTITENSSIKLKENVKESEGNLDKVLNLRPVEYNKIGSQTTELGLIAEEVATVYPEFVQYDENGDPIGVNYSRLTAALIGAVKELNQQIQELKKNNG
jgi:hypothetical protein